MTQTFTSHDVQAIPVGRLFNDPADHYSVPLYQRNYTWGEEQIHRLIQDVLDEARQAEPKEYFLGNLVVAPPKNLDDPFDVIDGQQRLTTLYILLSVLRRTPGFPAPTTALQPLTYEARDKATAALRSVARGGSTDRDAESDLEDSGIRRAEVIITELLSDPVLRQQLIDNRFVDYLLTEVLIIRMPIDRSTDLNQYFEIMNTRGAQLSPVDIAKARLLRCLQDPGDRALLNHVWSACSDMEHYVTMTATAGDTSWRAAVFGETWEQLPTDDFAELRDLLVLQRPSTSASVPDTTSAAPSSAMELGEAITLYARTETVQEFTETSDSERFTSQITFPTFLLHVLAVRPPAGDTTSLDRQLDDKQLVERFTQRLEDLDSAQREEWVRSFTTDLLRLRVLFDKYVLKRDATLTSGHESTSDEEPGSWSLYRVVRGESSSTGTVRYSPRYRPTLANDESGAGPRSLQRRILLLQSALRITYTSPRTMHWITEALRFALDRADRGEAITAEGLYGVLQRHALERLDAALHPDPEMYSVGPDGLPLGFGIPRIVFTYLDYLLVERENRWDFTFSYRTSIEHFSPSSEDAEHASPAEHVEDRKLLNYLGNLALVTVSTNSKFSNYQPVHKAQNQAARRQSVKLDLMARRALLGSWTDADILEHHEDMSALLFQALGQEPPELRATNDPRSGDLDNA
ncbi:hypothetical protein BH708_16285 [Brachybacterium sp. P6-10-X1]|uniref:DUF262 domain-containing protein n=1 Tax=Brachybacterium sp. P6-10-X1 TaxID=1903186 RepID=UPI000971AC4B|nr:DUF262 domain-containing protein [Brachybacterium sp. P6-10-X1]APX34011.1 hypothetical protein BH708_16285 [Brachybacterium sp. P6-10-X1]